MNQKLLHNFIVEEHIKNSLKEDIGFGDVTTDFLYKDEDYITAVLNTREAAVVCGIEVFRQVFSVLSDKVSVKTFFSDGDFVDKNTSLAEVSGPARAVLTGERTALNYVQRMSGIATETNKYQKAIGAYLAKIVDTRKTTPGFRAFEKYSVKMGGGTLHRFNLSDCAMIKDNHIKYAGSITKAVEKLRKHISHAHKIEVECDTLNQVREALGCNVDIIMLDNMSIEDMREAVKLINHKAVVEASGNVNLNTVNEIASTGVDIISSSAIVAKAPTLDLGLDCR